MNANFSDRSFVNVSLIRLLKQSPKIYIPDLKMGLVLVESGGKVRSHHAQLTNVKTLLPILKNEVKQETILMTDEAKQYVKIGKEFNDHGAVVHSRKEYVRGTVHSNTIEGFFSIFKRGMKGVYQHCKSNHLKRYLCEL